MHLSETSSIAQYLKTFLLKNWFLENSYRKKDNIRIKNNKQKSRILEALHIRKKLPKHNRINFESSTNVLKCL